MKEIKEILSKFDYDSKRHTGFDGKYHTVYLIEFESGHYYIGKHTSTDIDNDNYLCSGKLPGSKIKRGELFDRTILFFADTSELAISIETDILSTKSIFENDSCLNCYPGSPPDAAGTIIISNKNKFKMINPKMLDYYLENGWKKGGNKRFWMNKEDKSKFVLEENIEKLENEGWVLGNKFAKNRVFIKKNNNFKFVKKNLVEKYIKDGWIQIHNVQDRKVVRKGDQLLKIKPEELESYLNKGFVRSSTVDGLIYIKKNRKFKRVKNEQLEEYLKDGWSLGNNTSGKIYINNGKKEKRIYEDELIKYPEWKKGKLKTIFLSNGKIRKKVYLIDKKKIDELLNSGFVYGYQLN